MNNNTQNSSSSSSSFTTESKIFTQKESSQILANQFKIPKICLENYDVEFKKFIQFLLKRTGLSDFRIQEFTDSESMIEFRTAFTHHSYDAHCNYEYYETLGDASLNRCIVWYFHYTYPEIRLKARAEAILSRLKIEGASKTYFPRFAKILNFGSFIRYDANASLSKGFDGLLEDTFEAFAGSLECVVEQKTRVRNVGICLVYNFLASILDTMDIQLDANALFDSVTKLKELYDVRKDIQHEEIFEQDPVRNVWVATSRAKFTKDPRLEALEHGIRHFTPDQWMVLAKTEDRKKETALHALAEKTFSFLKTQYGITRQKVL
jgi:dsRNA-specific ribonuclease